VREIPWHDAGGQVAAGLRKDKMMKQERRQGILQFLDAALVILWMRWGLRCGYD